MPPPPTPEAVAAIQRAIATMPASGSVNDLGRHFFDVLDDEGFVVGAATIATGADVTHSGITTDFRESVRPAVAIPLPNLETRFEGAAKAIDVIRAFPPETESHEAMWKATLALDEAGFVIARVENVVPLRPRRTPHDLTPCDVDPSPETAA